MPAVLFYRTSMKTMLVMTMCSKNYASTICQNLMGTLGVKQLSNIVFFLKQINLNLKPEVCLLIYNICFLFLHSVMSKNFFASDQLYSKILTAMTLL